MVFDEAIEESADFYASPEHTQALINNLSDDIEDSIEVEQFRSKAYKAINNILNSNGSSNLTCLIAQLSLITTGQPVHIRRLLCGKDYIEKLYAPCHAII